jgi:hypothetical protein
MAETKTVNLNVETNLGSLKSQLRQAQNEVNALSEKFGATSDQAIKAAKNASILKDKIGDAKALTDAFNPDAKFNALSSSLGGVASGFAAYQGAMGLAGVESKDLEEQLLKVQSAMAVAQGLQGLGEARDSFKQLKAVAIDAFKGIKTAIGSTGIGLLVVALGAIYTYWDDIKELVGGVSEEQANLNIKVEKNVTLENEKLDKIGEQDNILRSQGKTEKQILEYKIAQIEAVQLASKIQLENDYITKKNQIEAAKRNHDYLKGFLDFVTFPQKKLTEFFFTFVNQAIGVLNKLPGVDIDKFNVDKILKNFDGVNTKIANLIFDPKETTLKADAVIKEHKKGLVKLENDKQGLLLQIKNIDNEEIKSNKDKNDQITEDNKTAGEKHKQDLIDNANALNEALAESDAARQKQKQDLAAADEKMRADGLEKLKENARAQLKINEEEAAAAKLLKSQKIDAVQSTLSTIGNLAELFAGKSKKQQEQAFKIQKAVNIANATIDTYKAATGAYSSLSAIPVVGPALGIAAAGLALSAGLLNVKKIASTKFDASGGGGTPPSGGGGGGGTNAMQGNVITPNFNIVGNNGTNQLQQLKQAPIQAYVVSGEMSTQQSLDRNRLRNATL